MRPVLLLLPLLAACASHADTPLSNRAPGMDIAEVALAHGAPETALHVAETALAANPRDVRALVAAARAQAALGRNDQAIASYQQALAVAPDDGPAALGLGRLQLTVNPAAAVAVLRRVTANDPQNVPALIDLGIANDLTGQHGDAQRAYRAALALDPQRVATSVNLGLSLALSGDPDQALAILRPLAAAPEASPRMRQDLAAALVLAGDNEEAVAVLHADMPPPQVVATIAGYRQLRAP